MKKFDNEWMRHALAEGLRQEKEIKILGLDVNDAFAQDDNGFNGEGLEARKYLGRLEWQGVESKVNQEGQGGGNERIQEAQCLREGAN